MPSNSRCSTSRATSSSASRSKVARRILIAAGDTIRVKTARVRVCSGGSASSMMLGGRPAGAFPEPRQPPSPPAEEVPRARPFHMPSPDQVASSRPDDPALLRIEGPIATITLNRPAAYNSIDLSIARKLEQLGAEVEASDEITVLVIEGEGRAFCAGGDLQTIGAAAAADTIAPVVGELLKHYHAFITTLRRMPKIALASVHRF